jgi:hypothetical protein
MVMEFTGISTQYSGTSQVLYVLKIQRPNFSWISVPFVNDSEWMKSQAILMKVG